MHNLMSLLILLILVVSACSDDSGSAPVDTPGIEAQDTVIELVPETPDGIPARSTATPSKFEYEIKYTARILPVEFNGKTVQANAIALGKNFGYAAYNEAGEPFNGAFQILKLSGARPVLEKQYELPEFEITAIYLNGTDLYLGGRGNIDHPYQHLGQSRTAIARLNTEEMPDTAEDLLQQFKPLYSGHAVTGISGDGTSVFITTGASNAAILQTDSNLQQTASNSYDNLRSIACLNSTPYALQGDAASGSILCGLQWTPYNIDAPGSTEAKATIQAVPTAEEPVFDDADGALFLGLGTAGSRVYRAASGALSNVFVLNNPTSDSNHVNNSTVYQNGLIFTANGEYGFRVLQINGLPRSTDMDNFQTLPGFASIIGYHRMEGSVYNGMQYSANDIAWNGNFLFVAAGAGGINVYQLKRSLALDKIPLSGTATAALENGSLTPATVSSLHNDNTDSVVQLKLTNDAKVYAVFYNETAGYLNRFGYYIYDTGNAPNSAEQITPADIFPNASKTASGGVLKEGDAVYLGTVPNGKTLGFFLQQNGFRNSTGSIWYSDKRLNSDNAQHFIMAAADPIEGLLLLSVEDLTGLGDRDFSDLIVYLKVEPFSAIDLSGVPSLQ